MEQASHPVLNEEAVHHVLDGVPLHPTNVDEALHALNAVTERLLELGDGRAAFPDIYGIITRKVAEQVHAHQGLFLEPRWISRLAGRFCERYLETLRWSLSRDRQDCGAWLHAYGCAAVSESTPAQNVLLGISAHINYDLALGIRDTIVAFGHQSCPEMIARYKHDHDQVNALLDASVPEAFDHLIERHRCPVSAMAYARAFTMVRWCTMQVLSKWRGRVWRDMLSLLNATSPEAEAEIVQQMNRRADQIGRALSLPSALPLARALSTRPPESRSIAKDAASVAVPKPAPVPALSAEDIYRLCA